MLHNGESFEISCAAGRTPATPVQLSYSRQLVLLAQVAPFLTATPFLPRGTAVAPGERFCLYVPATTGRDKRAKKNPLSLQVHAKNEITPKDFAENPERAFLKDKW